MQETGAHRRYVFSPFPGWVALALLAFTGVCSAREKKDVLIMKNGDHITCEIKRLQKGYLYINLAYGDGTVSIDWTKVASVTSPQVFVVADVNGNRYTGVLKDTTEPNGEGELKVLVAGGTTPELIPGNNVVDIEQIEFNVFQNLHGSADAGFTYTKQQNRNQYSLNANAVYARAKWAAAVTYGSSFSGGGSGSSLRNDLLLEGTRQMRTPRNFYMGLAQFQHNTEQELSLRTALGSAYGRTLTNTNNSVIAVFAGGDWNHERYFPQATGSHGGNSAEAIVGTQLNFFRFRTTNFLVDSRAYPSLTDLGRVRFEINTSVKLRIAKDLYWNLSYYLNVDSRPPQNLPQTDYGSTTSLGWTF
jgi:hypothetical protein